LVSAMLSETTRIGSGPFSIDCMLVQSVGEGP
jgi:hypothetical protein